MSGVLSVVSTPIGHLGDMTHRAIEALKRADLILCEDTRHSQTLFSHYGISRPLQSYHDFSEKAQAPRLVARLKEGASIALVSDAGTPVISDPGYVLIRQALEAGVRVEAVPGPSAFLAALVLSGLPADRFVFEGFFPPKPTAVRKRLEVLKHEERTVLFYASPHKLLKNLEAIREVLGDIQIVVARELTKKFEEVVRKDVSGMIAHFSASRIRGEFVVLWHRSSTS